MPLSYPQVTFKCNMWDSTCRVSHFQCTSNIHIWPYQSYVTLCWNLDRQFVEVIGACLVLRVSTQHELGLYRDVKMVRDRFII